MSFRICKVVDAGPIWLKSLLPVVRWGPLAQAKIFDSREEALRASRFLPVKDRQVTIVEEAEERAASCSGFKAG